MACGVMVLSPRMTNSLTLISGTVTLRAGRWLSESAGTCTTSVSPSFLIVQ